MTHSFKRAVTFLCFVTVLVLVGTGCRNTAHGFGRDVEKAGDKIQEKTR